jgi:hypothetical protein
MMQQVRSGHPRPERNDPREALAFVVELAGELSEMARRHRFAALAYLLDMARLEAETLRRDMRDPAGEEADAQASETRPPA